MSDCEEPRSQDVYQDKDQETDPKRRWLMSAESDEAHLDLSIEEQKCGPEHREPLFYFRLFFTEQLIETIVEQCNQYAKLNFDEKKRVKTSMWATWKDVSVEEFDAFVGTVLNMGMRPHPNLQDFFSTTFTAYMPFFRAMFKRQRFLQIYIVLNKIVERSSGNKKLNIEVNCNAAADQCLLTTDCFLYETACWWQKPFYWGLKKAVKYGYILHKKKEKQSNALQYVRFVDKLITELIGDFRGGTSKIQRGHTPDTLQRLNGILHIIMPASEKMMKDCTVCSTKSDRKRTMYYCATCEAKPSLHVGVCFEKYHTWKEYREDSASDE